MTYTDPALISAFIKRNLTDNEQLTLSVMIPAIQVWLDKKLGTTFLPASAATNRYYDGGESSIDTEPFTALVEIASYDSYNNADLYLYNQTITEVLTEPRNETVKNEIRLRSSCFPEGEDNIRVKAYFSSYDSGIPEDITSAATMIATDMLRVGQVGTDNVKRENLEGHLVEYNDPNLMIQNLVAANPMVQSILELRRELMI